MKAVGSELIYLVGEDCVWGSGGGLYSGRYQGVRFWLVLDLFIVLVVWCLCEWETHSSCIVVHSHWTYFG